MLTKSLSRARGPRCSFAVRAGINRSRREIPASSAAFSRLAPTASAEARRGLRRREIEDAREQGESAHASDGNETEKGGRRGIGYGRL
jgi:hypothetical protein